MWFKKLTVPATNETKQVDAVQMWEVRWRSRNGQYYTDTKDELECFPSEAQAKYFAAALKAAFKLIRHTSGTSVSVKKGASL